MPAAWHRHTVAAPPPTAAMVIGPPHSRHGGMTLDSYDSRKAARRAWSDTGDRLDSDFALQWSGVGVSTGMVSKFLSRWRESLARCSAKSVWVSASA